MKRPFLINKRIRPPFLILWAITSSNDYSLINNWRVCGGVVTSWLVCLPAHGIRALDEDIAMGTTPPSQWLFSPKCVNEY